MSESIAEKPLNALTHKIGPLPGFAWVLIVGGLAYGVYWWRSRGTASSIAPGATVSATDGTVTGISDGSGGFGGGSGVSGGSYSGQVNTLPVGQAAVTNNAQWAATAGNALIAAGQDPSAVSNALSKYLNGGTLTAQEQAIVNIAVRQYQLPPEGVLPIKAPAPVAPVVTVKPAPVVAPKPVAPKPAPAKPVPKPAPKPAAPKPVAVTYHNYTVKSGDSLSAIAQRTWGRDAWQTLYADNRGVVGGNPNLIRPGMVLKVRNKL